MASDAGTVPPGRGPEPVLDDGTSTAPLPAPVPAEPQDSGTGTGPAASTGRASGAEPVLVLPGTVQPMTVPQRAADATVRAVMELWLHPDRFLHSLLHGKADTMREQRAHIKSRSWVPEEMTGWPRRLVTAAGVLHYLLIAHPVKAAMKAAKFAAEKGDQAADRALPFYLLVVFTIVLFLLLARYL